MNLKKLNLILQYKEDIEKAITKFNDINDELELSLVIHSYNELQKEAILLKKNLFKIKNNKIFIGINRIKWCGKVPDTLEEIWFDIHTKELKILKI